MTTIGSVEDYAKLKALPAGGFDVVIVRNQKAFAASIPLSSPLNDAIFVWDKEASEGDDGGSMISPVGGPSPTLKGRWKRVFNDILSVLSVKWFGAKGDMKEYQIEPPGAPPASAKRYKGKIITGTDILELTSTDSTGFTIDDEQKTIIIWKAGTGSLPLVTTIKVRQSNTKVQLNMFPEAMSDAFVAWGTDDTDAIQHAIDVAKETGLPVYLPPGHFLITKTLSYTTVSVKGEQREDTYQLMRHGLQMFGAGPQISFLHNQIKDGGATISIDGKSFSFQQTGYLKDFHITSTGQLPNTTGIDMRATWGYSIQNVHVMKMGSHGIILRNSPDAVGSDGDACENVYLDNVFTYRNGWNDDRNPSHNGGWGIIVDAGDRCLSTGFIRVERCKFTQNKGGGIQWTGQMGVIDSCGFYGNGVIPGGPNWPSPVSGAYGILVKNVRGTSDGLLITGCEIQGNAEVQLMVEVGGNIKIVKNEFKVDNFTLDTTFPTIDIQVGDANLGDTDTDFQNVRDEEKIKILLKDVDVELNPDEYKYKIIELSGKPTKTLNLIFPLIEGKEWLVVNNSNIVIKILDEGLKYSGVVVWPNSETAVYIFKDELKRLSLVKKYPRLVNACVIEDNSIRAEWHEGNKAAWGGDRPHMPKHTVVKVNSNAVGTIIRGWWRRNFPNDNDKYKLVDMVEDDPFTHKRLPINPVSYLGKIHLKTHLHRDGENGGHVLLPFASNRFRVDGTVLHDDEGNVDERLILYSKTNPDPTAPFDKATFIPDTSQWSHYYIIIANTIESLTLGNPTVRTVGAPLFFEFINLRSHQSVAIRFGSEYVAGNGIDLSYNEIVSGIMIFDETYNWRLFSPWTCGGAPLRFSGIPPESKVL